MRQTRLARRRPMLISIAAILLLLLGGVQLLLAITDFFARMFGALAPLEDSSNVVWGSVDVLFALTLVCAATRCSNGKRPGGRSRCSSRYCLRSVGRITS